MPASPWELRDAMDKVRLERGRGAVSWEIRRLRWPSGTSRLIWTELDISLNELNDLAARAGALDEVQEAAFEGLFSMEVQRKVNANGGIIYAAGSEDLAVSARTDCYHVVERRG